MKTVIIFFSIILVYSTAWAQQLVTGRITDAADGTPVPGASVFIANTTIGIASDASGNYSLTVPGKGSFEIVVSHVGYQSVFHKIDMPRDAHRHDVVLRTNELEEITIKSAKTYTNRDVNIFWQKILGEKPSRNGMQALNAEKVYFYLNSENNVLKAWCQEPIEVINHQMGYRILYVLQSFEHNYQTNETKFYGMPQFEELVPQNNRQKNNWEKKRREVYAVSLHHFMRALFRGQLHEEGFLVININELDILSAQTSNNLAERDISSHELKFAQLEWQQTQTDYQQAGRGDTQRAQQEYQQAQQKYFQVYQKHNSMKYIGSSSSISEYRRLIEKLSVPFLETATDHAVLNMTHKDTIDNQHVVRTNIEEPHLLICLSKPAAELREMRMSFPVMLGLSPQQFTVYSDGTYTGLLNIQEYQNSITGLSAMLPVEYEYQKYLSQWDVPQVFGQDLDSELSKFNPYLQALQNFSRNTPQEKVYLHLDNTNYYQGDHIWFKCYVTSAQHQLSELSKTLYVELLNPGGEIVDKRVLKIENGQCHGDFSLNQLPFYSGFYEVRAYTKYMLNFGDDVIFSRLLPVFDKPKTEGNFDEKAMLSYGRWGSKSADGRYQMKRERPEKGKAVNLRFYPEGGNLIQGVASRVAFEATDEAGNPIDVTGVVMDGNKLELSRITTLHEGRGIFAYTPTSAAGRRKDVADVEYAGRKYQFDMPAALSQGIVMEVDNLSHSDSIAISLRKSMDTPAEMLGVALLNGGKLQIYCYVWMENSEISFKMHKTWLPSGVSQIVLFNGAGEILCDRLVFTNLNELLNDELLDIRTKTNKPTYRPHELVDMEISVTDKEANPVQTSFSLSVRDGDNEVESNHNILTDLLLMSEIKGYVRNPSYYFEKDDETRRAALDLLLMVQGWRRYSWKQMAEVEPFEQKYLPEQGLETTGNVVRYNTIGRQMPKPVPEVDVDMLLLQKRDENDAGSFIETFVTDDQGRFSFVTDVEGRWNMILSVKEKRNAKKYQIMLDRLFSPEPKRYRYADLQIRIAEKISEQLNDEESPDDDGLEDDYTSFLAAYQDSIAKLGIDEKVHQIEEITIKAKRRTKEQDIFHNRSTSIAYYDVASEMDDFYDKGKYIGENIHNLLINMNQNFDVRQGIIEWMSYKNKPAVFVVNHERVDISSEVDFFKYKNIRVQTIKAIYINETVSAKCQYAYHPMGASCDIIDRFYGCIVFIETYPEGKIPVEGAKGVRKTWLEGYSAVSEFYSPNYSAIPLIPDDYRRTLYWNPMVCTDEEGKAKIQFYNNSRSKNFSISAETVTQSGMIGIYKRE